MGNNRDKLIKYLYNIKEISDLYEERNYKEVIKKINLHILKPSDKKKLKNSFNSLNDSFNGSIEDVIKKANELNLILIDDKLNEFIVENVDLYNEVKTLSFRQFISLYEYEQEKTPYSTQHGVKGAEFENVLVVLDNGKWNQYNFKYLFENTGTENIINKTRKIFYVCCSRAKNNLVVFCQNPSASMINQAKIWFGDANVKQIP